MVLGAAFGNDDLAMLARLGLVVGVVLTGQIAIFLVFPIRLLRSLRDSSYTVESGGRLRGAFLLIGSIIFFGFAVFVLRRLVIWYLEARFDHGLLLWYDVLAAAFFSGLFALAGVVMFRMGWPLVRSSTEDK
jgi:hypothetical protein